MFLKTRAASLLSALLFLTATTVFGAAYVLGPKDIISITVYEQPDLTQRVRIGEEGSINLPLIGQVKASGQTVELLEGLLTSKYRDFIRDPQVQVFVVEYHSKEISVLGQVTQPGLYKLSGNTTLLEVISKVGGLKDDHGPELMVMREKDKEKGISETITIDVAKLLSPDGMDLNILVLDGDVINVPKSQAPSTHRFFLMGEVSRPGPYPLPADGTTMTVFKAISTAGGFTDRASKRRIKIHREVGEQTMTFKADMDTVIRPQDIVIVPESFF